MFKLVFRCVFSLWIFLFSFVANAETPQVVLQNSLLELADNLEKIDHQMSVKPLVVVLGIVNENNGKRDEVSEILEQQLTLALQNRTSYNVVSYKTINSIRLDWLSAFPDARENLNLDLAGLVGADWFLSGGYRQLGGRIEFDLQVYEILTERYLWNSSIPILFELPDDMQISEEIETQTEDETLQEPIKLNTENMVLIPAGNILLGDMNGEPDEQPTRTIFVKSFRIDTVEITNDAFSQCSDCEKGSGIFNTTLPQQPVVYVDWENAHKYCTSQGKRLPTEAEWEKAARAGSLTAYSFGNDASMLDRYSWYEKNTIQQGIYHAQAVAQKEANALGLYDMHGNVMEWVQDWYDPKWYHQEPSANPVGPEQPVNAEYPQKVVRGGAWGGAFGVGDPKNLRSAKRFAYAPWVKSFHIGFRCAVDASVTTEMDGQHNNENPPTEISKSAP